MLHKSIAIGFVLGTLAVVPAGAQTSASVLSENAPKASLTVSLTGIRNDKGQGFYQLWNAPEGFPKQAQKAYKFIAIDASKAVDGAVTGTFSNLPPALTLSACCTTRTGTARWTRMPSAFRRKGGVFSNNAVTPHARALL